MTCTVNVPRAVALLSSNPPRPHHAAQQNGMPQVVVAQRLTRSPEGIGAVTNVVFMGMGASLPHSVSSTRCCSCCAAARCALCRGPSCQGMHAPRQLLQRQSWHADSPHCPAGEPLDNMAALLPALDIIGHPHGLQLSLRKVGSTR